VMNYLEGRGTLCRYPWLNFPAHVGIAGLCLLLLSPLACAFVREKAPMSYKHLEPELRVRCRIDFIVFTPVFVAGGSLQEILRPPPQIRLLQQSLTPLETCRKYNKSHKLNRGCFIGCVKQLKANLLGKSLAARLSRPSATLHSDSSRFSPVRVNVGKWTCILKNA
jgi:hypothetical protein